MRNTPLAAASSLPERATSERQSLSIKVHAGNLSDTPPSRHFINRMCFALVALPLDIASISNLRERSWKGGK